MAISARKQTEISEKIKLIPSIMTTIADHDKNLEKVKKTMLGNGEPGWDERLRNIEKYIELQIAKENRRIAWWEKFQWVIIPMAISGLLVFIGQAIIFYFKIFPLIEGLK